MAYDKRIAEAMQAQIMRLCKEDVRYVGDFSQAVLHGSVMAAEEAERRTGDADTALRSALIILPPSSATGYAGDQLIQHISRHLSRCSPERLSPVEQKWLQAYPLAPTPESTSTAMDVDSNDD